MKPIYRCNLLKERILFFRFIVYPRNGICTAEDAEERCQKQALLSEKTSSY
jgi:hypothetical protein